LNAVDFPDACEALLREVLKAAGLLTPTGGAITRLSTHRTTLLDLGFGCGDQTLYLNQKLAKIVQGSNDEGLQLRGSEIPLLNHYIGITLDQEQFKYASDRLRQVNNPSIQIYCADAANPALWNDRLDSEVKQLASNPSLNYILADEHNPVDVDCWVLALDTLYHFSPSRSPILDYARKELNASIMAFDLLLTERTSFISRLLLALVAALMGCPYDTFKTTSEYRAMLISAGYLDKNIEITDVSEHVFRPLVAFLERRESHLEEFGWSLGRLKAAKCLFNWWASNGAVKGAIIVARK
jgi:hypothetical protein